MRRPEDRRCWAVCRAIADLFRADPANRAPTLVLMTCAILILLKLSLFRSLVAVHVGLPDVASLSTAVSMVIGNGWENFREYSNSLAVGGNSWNYLAIVFGLHCQMAKAMGWTQIYRILVRYLAASLVVVTRLNLSTENIMVLWST